MGGLECVITGLMDEFKDFFNRWNINREMFTGMIVSVSFVVALCCVTPVSIIRVKLIMEFLILVPFNAKLKGHKNFCDHRNLKRSM